ncbi:endonuclease/exonuclease/phosphatase family protein [Sphaerotilus sp.]|uniref:endonuclease/exonuclease/phosphatase family protein n=1 Tax=Sphaerotilus sp. TaxID=2093942 RepID=UPI0034E3035E
MSSSPSTPSALQWLARLAVAASLVCAVGLAGLYQFGPARSGWAELLRYVPFLLYTAPAALALLLSLALGWWWRLGALLALGLMGTAVMDLSLGRGRTDLPPDAPGTRTVRFMTYNIKSYRAVFREGGFVPLNNEIAQQQPDILVMQDAREVSRQGDLPYGMRAVLPKHRLYTYGQYAVASRFPISGCAPADLSLKDEKFDYVRCTVDIDGTRIDLVTAHLLTPREGLNATREDRLQSLAEWRSNFADRLSQAERIAAVLTPLKHPTIVAGDLNAPEHSVVVRTLLDLGLRDAFSAAGRGWGFTHGHSLKPGVSFLRIDHILVSPEIGVREAHVGWRGGSEHRPVVADLVIPTKSAAP